MLRKGDCDMDKEWMGLSKGYDMSISLTLFSFLPIADSKRTEGDSKRKLNMHANICLKKIGKYVLPS